MNLKENRGNKMDEIDRIKNKHNYEYCLALTTLEDYDIALKMKNIIFSKKLALDITIIDNAEFYFMPNPNLNDEESYLLLIKTRTDLLEELKREILILHSNDAADFIVLPILDINIHYKDEIDRNLKRYQ